MTVVSASPAAVVRQPEAPSMVERARPISETRTAAADAIDTALWVPKVGTSWQWQLSGTLNLSVSADVFDVDGFETSAAAVATLHAKGRRVICYIDVGASEDYRPDASSFPSRLLGKTNGWPGERYLDIRDIATLKPLMAARFDMCKAKGFDAIEADLVANFQEDTGFPITAAHQLTYNRMLAGLAHERGLSIGLKNDPDQVVELLDDFDFAVVEECYVYSECNAYKPFIAAGKAVLHVEYAPRTSKFCPVTGPLGFSSMKKKLALGAWRELC